MPPPVPRSMLEPGARMRPGPLRDDAGQQLTPRRGQPWYVHACAALAALATALGAWTAARTPSTDEVARASDPVAVRVEALAVEVEWLRWQARQVQQGCRASSPVDDDFAGPPPSLAPLPRIRGSR